MAEKEKRKREPNFTPVSSEDYAAIRSGKKPVGFGARAKQIQAAQPSVSQIADTANKTLVDPLLEPVKSAGRAFFKGTGIEEDFNRNNETRRQRSQPERGAITVGEASKLESPIPFVGGARPVPVVQGTQSVAQPVIEQGENKTSLTGNNVSGPEIVQDVADNGDKTYSLTQDDGGYGTMTVHGNDRSTGFGAVRQSPAQKEAQAMTERFQSAVQRTPEGDEARRQQHAEWLGRQSGGAVGGARAREEYLRRKEGLEKEKVRTDRESSLANREIDVQEGEIKQNADAAAATEAGINSRFDKEIEYKKSTASSNSATLSPAAQLKGRMAIRKQHQSYAKDQLGQEVLNFEDWLGTVYSPADLNAYGLSGSDMKGPLADLEENPALALQFKQKYGYLPQGY